MQDRQEAASYSDRFSRAFGSEKIIGAGKDDEFLSLKCCRTVEGGLKLHIYKIMVITVPRCYLFPVARLRASARNDASLLRRKLRISRPIRYVYIDHAIIRDVYYHPIFSIVRTI